MNCKKGHKEASVDRTRSHKTTADRLFRNEMKCFLMTAGSLSRKDLPAMFKSYRHRSTDGFPNGDCAYRRSDFKGKKGWAMAITKIP
ncbi:hypothetical protein BG011_001490 [Mortierella polycephala]|uniref:Uncharacterized protein n=1 Tax=Mortierella polycephala TaxID=41804 RepID=A0A9P6QII6_9FUNG|nr:hypothetical protein BG011_001490 [Mortierella polycephala]